MHIKKSTKPTHLSLFSGIGGLDLAAEQAGFATVGQCEWADYPTKILEKHWPDVPRWRDIRTLTKEDFYEKTGFRTVDLISGGFPCQPFSVAGNQKGKEDDRYLWPEMLRVIRELEPSWVVGENVPGILRIAAADVVQDLEREGFECVLFDFEAAAVGALHRRERIAFVANAYAQRLQRSEQPGTYHAAWQSSPVPTCECCCVISNAPVSLSSEERIAQQRHNNAGGMCLDGIRRRWPAEPGLGRMADGLPDWLDEPAGIPRIAKGVKNRVDRLKCTGNAVVPRQFYPIFAAIESEIRRERRT